MRTVLAYTPPDLQEARPGVVSRRLVFFLAGYDPEARSRYRMLFVRELLLSARRFGEPAPKLGRLSEEAGGLSQVWQIGPRPEIGDAAVDYEVLHWDDLVVRDGRRLRLVNIGLLVVGTLHALAVGLLWRFYRFNHRYGNVIVYPFVMVVALALISGLIAALVHPHLGSGFAHSLGLPLALSLPLALAIGVAWIAAIDRPLNRMFFWLLLRSWVFHWQHGQGWRPDYEARLDAFAERAAARIAEACASDEPPDEILLIGHSTGGLTAAELAARLLDRMPDLGETGPALSLATLGSALPLVVIQPRAVRLRAQVARLVASRRLVWCDFQAPQDWMNFPGFNPVLDADLPDAGGTTANPIVRSAQFKRILTPETYAKVRNRPFRMHFQFLMANELPGEYDYFRMVLGPQYLRDRALQPIIGPEPVRTRR
ncbi:alpha/beta hydrolase [Methylobacterium dankookense]|uniref:Uncharacterized protein n=1 Tax=Methylobacterium dankookense TaxID=560405 RepID=A0A564FYY1_9HYPH|nr:alpha/beta hydrolase [Methylobacterium dankookense]GJD59418.1 hypothetical protein IFDJLNFL_5346 [Methylobacterium dankookense]VUF13363.1 hypothetical protein MTDSW087_03065 [Methylobacterium dankookense]